MEKICIVKLRKKEPAAVPAEERRGVEGALFSNPPASLLPGSLVSEPGAADQTLSLTLTAAQTEALRGDPWRLNLLNGEFTAGTRSLAGQERPLIVKFDLEPISPLRLLTPAEVAGMLRIGRSLLATLRREGQLKSYKIGRFRRYMLADVLAYLEKQQDDRRSVCPGVSPSPACRQEAG